MYTLRNYHMHPVFSPPTTFGVCRIILRRRHLTTVAVVEVLIQLHHTTLQTLGRIYGRPKVNDKIALEECPRTP